MIAAGLIIRCIVKPLFICLQVDGAAFLRCSGGNGFVARKDGDCEHGVWNHYGFMANVDATIVGF